MPEHDLSPALICCVMEAVGLDWIDAARAVEVVRQWDFEQYRIGLEREHEHQTLVA